MNRKTLAASCFAAALFLSPSVKAQDGFLDGIFHDWQTSGWGKLQSLKSTVEAWRSDIRIYEYRLRANPNLACMTQCTKANGCSPPICYSETGVFVTHSTPAPSKSKVD